MLSGGNIDSRLLSAVILVSSFVLREWLNFALGFLVTGLVLVAGVRTRRRIHATRRGRPSSLSA